MRSRGQAIWSNVSGSPVAELRRWFLDRRFREVCPWEWCHLDDSTIRVSALSSDKSHLKRMSHFIREGWRFYCWDQVLQTSRHEITTVGHVQASDLRQVRASAVRALSEPCSACRPVAVGVLFLWRGFMPGLMRRSRRGVPGVPLSVPGSMRWECESSPLRASRPPIPSLGITRWFRWSPSPGPVLKVLAEVQKAVWDHRYNRS